MNAMVQKVPPLAPTGERMVPESADRRTFWQHVYRYAFASRLIAGKRVLDIACGEGYGAAAMRKAGAKSVTGIDISEEACSHARERYGIDARRGDAENIPLADGSVDVVVSFETVEHLPNPPRFLAECARVLVPGGRLIISTPNKDVYSRPARGSNPYHCSEMTEREFISALGAAFIGIDLYTQHPYSAGWWSLRALAADVAPRIPGYARLRRAAQFRFFPRAVYDPQVEERLSVVDEVLAARRARSHPLNCNAVRKRRPWTGEKPTYLIATAIRRTQEHADR